MKNEKEIKIVEMDDRGGFIILKVIYNGVVYGGIVFSGGDIDGKEEISEEII